MFYKNSTRYSDYEADMSNWNLIIVENVILHFFGPVEKVLTGEDKEKTR